MLLNPLIATLHNSATNRWHPILFAQSPLPGDASPVRHKSKGHHTLGFDTLDAAAAYSKEDLSPRMDGARFEAGTVFEWDGNEIPALVHFFESCNLVNAPVHG